LGLFKEWWHFNLIDDGSGLDALINFSFGGDLYQPGAGEANLIILGHLPETGWIGGIDTFDGLAARLDLESVGIAIGQSSIRCEADRYRLHLHRAEGSLAADLVFEPRAEPLTVWKNTPLGGGHINWMVAPYMDVSGRFRIGERVIEVADARGYHDHNWGAWRWGDFGWVWGFCSAGAGTKEQGSADSIVFNSSLDRAGSRAFEQSLLVWRGERLIKLFLRENIRSNSRGMFAGPVRRTPGAMNLIDHSRVTSVPRMIEMSARDGPDWIEARYEPDTAIQIAVPRETAFGLVELNETLGSLVAEGEVGGRTIRISRRACFEFVG
jgi:hypothetical protein